MLLGTCCLGVVLCFGSCFCLKIFSFVLAALCVLLSEPLLWLAFVLFSASCWSQPRSCCPNSFNGLWLSGCLPWGLLILLVGGDLGVFIAETAHLKPSDSVLPYYVVAPSQRLSSPVLFYFKFACCPFVSFGLSVSMAFHGLTWACLGFVDVCLGCNLYFFFNECRALAFFQKKYFIVHKL
jgi:hypothetical protein